MFRGSSRLSARRMAAGAGKSGSEAARPCRLGPNPWSPHHMITRRWGERGVPRSLLTERGRNTLSARASHLLTPLWQQGWYPGRKGTGSGLGEVELHSPPSVAPPPLSESKQGTWKELGLGRLQGVVGARVRSETSLQQVPPPLPPSMLIGTRTNFCTHHT